MAKKTPQIAAKQKEQAQQFARAQRYFGIISCHRVHSRSSSHHTAGGACEPLSFAASSFTRFCSPASRSTGTGKMMVVFFSTPISVKVCKYRN